MSVFGIDLGTSYSCVAKCDGTGHIEVKKPSAATESTTPSVVCFKDGNIYVGKAAKNNMHRYADRCFSFVKREMKNEYLQQELDGRKVSPVEIQACILRHIFHQANLEVRNTDREQEVRKAVITIPAMFNDIERERTKLAAELAGIEVLALIQEPTAAAISCNIGPTETILVFDLGGGTLDVSIVKNDYGNLTVLGTPAGDPNLGGKDWDEALVKLALRSEGKSLDSDGRSSREWAELMTKAEECKKQLSESPSVEFYTTRPEVETEITRAQFETVTHGLVERAMQLVDKAINAAGQPEINRFVLVGGSSNMPMILQNLVQRYSSTYSKGRPTREWISLSNPHQAIAEGAAKYAGMLDGLLHNNINLQDKATHSYGFVVKHKGEEKVHNEILCTDPIVISHRKLDYMTASDNQISAKLCLIENESTDDNIDYDGKKPLVVGQIEWGYPVPKDTKVSIILSRDSNGIINVHAECQGKEIDFDTRAAKHIVDLDTRRQIEATIRLMKSAEK